MSGLRVAVVTVSDRSARGDRPDASGPRLAALVEAAGHRVTRRALVADDAAAVTAVLEELCDAEDAPELVLTTGGTGLGPRDRTPEATAAACAWLVPGIPEAIRAASLAHTPHAMLSRGLAGVRGRTLVVNLPGSPGGAADGWAVIARTVDHAAAQLRGEDHQGGGGA